MSQTKIGGEKARKTLLERDPDHFKKLGALGGKAKVPKGFAMNKELARKAGRKGAGKKRKKQTDVGSNEA